MTNAPLLKIDNLSVSFGHGEREVKAVRNISLDIGRGETVALVGESGSGKSVTALSVMQLLPYPFARHPSGSITFQDEELVGAAEPVLRKVRGDRISMIFQEPMTSLNPLHTIEKQVGEVLLIHRGLDKAQARVRILDLLHQVGLAEAEDRLGAYPHQLSGGQRQRVMIAMALANDPDLLIADEPTTALDVTIQAQILNLMGDLKSTIGAAIILITHDLGVIAEMAERVVVMYAGRKVEEAPVDQLFARPLHPYTHGLMGSVPRLNEAAAGKRRRLQEIKGMVPALNQEIVGCAFAPRCDFATDRCRREAHV